MPIIKINPTDDAFITNSCATDNYCCSTDLYTGSVGNNNYDMYRSLLKFDISKMNPYSKTILEAKLNLFIIKKQRIDAQLPQQRLHVYSNLSNFSQCTVNWVNAPKIKDSSCYTTVTDFNINNFVSIDVTSLVNAWYNNTIPNYGITLVGIENFSGSLIGFKSSRYKFIDRRPSLTIKYENFATVCLAGPTGPTGTTGATGTSLTANSAFASNTSGEVLQVVAGGTSIHLPNNQNVGPGMNLDATNTIFTVSNAGTYYISYHINLTTPLLISSRILINGTVDVASTVTSPLSVSSLNNDIIVNLPRESTILLQLFNFSGSAPLINGAGASLSIVRLR